MLRTGAWGLCDQALISACGFLTMVLLARSLGPAEFGTFALVYMALQIANSLQAALIVEPQSVLGATLRGEAYARYISSTAAGQGLFAGAAAAIALAAALISGAIGSQVAPLLAALAPATIAWQLQEFVRRVLYTQGRPGAAVGTDLVSYGGQAVLIVGFWSVEWLTPLTALHVLAATSAVGAAIGFWLIRAYFTNRLDPGVLGQHVKFGKWLVGARITEWTSNQLYPFLVAALVSVAATGILRAVQTIMGPTHILINGMGSWFTPSAARAYAAGGDAALRQFVGRICLITAPLMFGYCLVVGLFAETVLRLVYGDQYAEYGWVLVAFAIAYLLTYLTVPTAIALQARGITAPFFEANLWSTGLVLTLGVLAVRTFGLLGAVLGGVIHGVIENLVLWRRYLAARAA